MSEHTPGPWTYEDGEITSDVASGMVIARMITLDDLPCVDREDQAGCDRVQRMCDANGHVMAAATELLALLKEAVPTTDDGWWCPTCHEIVDGGRVTFQECHQDCGTYLGGVNDPEWVARARAAIARAEGSPT